MECRSKTLTGEKIWSECTSVVKPASQLIGHCPVIEIEGTVPVVVLINLRYLVIWHESSKIS